MVSSRQAASTSESTARRGPDGHGYQQREGAQGDRRPGSAGAVVGSARQGSVDGQERRRIDVARKLVSVEARVLDGARHAGMVGVGVEPEVPVVAAGVVLEEVVVGHVDDRVDVVEGPCHDLDPVARGDRSQKQHQQQHDGAPGGPGADVADAASNGGLIAVSISSARGPRLEELPCEEPDASPQKTRRSTTKDPARARGRPDGRRRVWRSTRRSRAGTTLKRAGAGKTLKRAGAGARAEGRAGAAACGRRPRARGQRRRKRLGSQTRIHSMVNTGVAGTLRSIEPCPRTCSPAVRSARVSTTGLPATQVKIRAFGATTKDGVRRPGRPRGRG